MSGRQDKIRRKIARKEVAPIVEKIKDNYELIVKNKPKYFPNFLWNWLISFFFTTKQNEGK